MRSALIVTGVMAAGIAMTPAVVPAVAIPATGHRLAVGTKHGDGHTVLEAKGRYVYTHRATSGKDVGCDAACRKVWPLVLSRNEPIARDGVKQRRLGLNRHHQVTYFHHRLYYFTYDTAAIPFGKNITSYGGKWQLITTHGGVG